MVNNQNQLEECFHEFHFLDINLKSFLIQEIQEMIINKISKDPKGLERTMIPKREGHRHAIPRNEQDYDSRDRFGKVILYHRNGHHDGTNE